MSALLVDFALRVKCERGSVQTRTVKITHRSLRRGRNQPRSTGSWARGSKYSVPWANGRLIKALKEGRSVGTNPLDGSQVLNSQSMARISRSIVPRISTSATCVAGNSIRPTSPRSKYLSRQQSERTLQPHAFYEFVEGLADQRAKDPMEVKR